MNFYTFMLHFHSGIRWILVILLIGTLLNSLIKWKGKMPFNKRDHSLQSFTVTLLHLQFLAGIILYAISPMVSFGPHMMGNNLQRFYTVEHVSLMVIAIIIITIGHIRSKKMEESARKFKTVFISFLIGFLVIMIAIPWPFRHLGAGWF
ncbi:MAG TPA: hypothetical protein VE912_25905 [Bacteroidales bacterium]|nr:hypothetical protein [Bacteroidales bacterium]